MNIIKHRKYIVEFDVWEAQQITAEAEFDTVLAVLKGSSHLGNVRVHLESEERTNG